jgi:RNA polymerase sigma-70 factor (ECF subfamily)
VELEEHLFRREAGRLVAILTGLLGIEHLALAEDVVQDAFCRALETWKFHGPPQNPSAWLLTTARRRALDVLRRRQTAHRYTGELRQKLQSEWTLAHEVEAAFDPTTIGDSQLRTMFSCVHPDLPQETQVALMLHLLCGFSMDETAAAFLKNGPAMQKRLRRAKTQLAASREWLDLSAEAELSARLPAVLQALYLLFNEGYHGASDQSPVRAELCDEALRLVSLLLAHPLTNRAEVHALASLLHFLAARLPARLDERGNLILLMHQDRTRWDPSHLAEGERQLALSAAGTQLSPYHVEAAIASLHAMAPSLHETNWDAVVSLYETLARMQPSPVVSLNRAVAIAERDGPARGLEEIERIGDRKRLLRYPFYHAAVAEFEHRLGRVEKARTHFGRALRLARNAAEQRYLESRLQTLQPATPSSVNT